MSEVSALWFEEAKKLEVGEAIFVRAANKKEQTAMANEFEAERDDFSIIDPVHASQIFILKTLKDGKQYVVLERRFRSPFVAFKKSSDGKFSKIEFDPERRRMLQLMVRDKKTREEIEEILNGLTDEEVTMFFSEK